MAGLFRIFNVRRAVAIALLCLSTGAVSAQDAAPIYPQGAPGVTAVGNNDEFLKQLNTAIDVTSRRYLTANVHTPWQIFHGVLALRKDFQLKLGNDKIGAIEWISTTNPQFDSLPLIMQTQYGGKFHPFTRPYAFEGHPAQFLALLSESDLPVTHSFKTSTGSVTVEDMLRNTMADVNDREEITWVLWSLTKYFKTNAEWRNKFGEAWSMERLAQIQTNAVVESAPCGGNHGMYALARVRDKYVREGNPLRGTWLNADQKVKRYIEIARSMQNQDGSFSSDFYRAPGFSQDLNTRLNTTGHTLEFLAAAVPDSRLKEVWVERAVAALSKDLIDNRRAAAECGPLYHSLNALMIYRGRVQPVATEVLKPVVPEVKKPEAPVPAPAPVPPATDVKPEVPKPVVPEPKPAEVLPVDPTKPGADAASAGPSVLPKVVSGVTTSLPAVAAPVQVPTIAEPPADALSPVRSLVLPVEPIGIKPDSTTELPPPPSRPTRVTQRLTIDRMPADVRDALVPILE